MHEVIALHRHIGGAAREDGGGIVDHGINAAEPVDRRLDRRFHGGFVTDIALHRQRLAARRFNAFRSGMDRAFQTRIRLVRLGRDDDIGPVPRAALTDGQADPAAGAGDENGFALETHDRSPLCLLWGESSAVLQSPPDPAARTVQAFLATAAFEGEEHGLGTADDILQRH